MLNSVFFLLVLLIVNGCRVLTRKSPQSGSKIRLVRACLTLVIIILIKVSINFSVPFFIVFVISVL